VLSTRKKLLFAFVTVCGFFVLLEGLLGTIGVRPILYREDPFVGFASNVPLFVEEAAPGATYMVTSPSKIRWFNKQRFLKKKPAGTYRIFTVGGSTTYGHPYEDPASFSGWLREFLPAADPSKQWEVINAGGISYASYRVSMVMEELARYEPDLFVIYSGQNEFLERRTYRGMTEAHSRDKPSSKRKLVRSWRILWGRVTIRATMSRKSRSSTTFGSTWGV
jgi:hypothetical protein